MVMWDAETTKTHRIGIVFGSPAAANHKSLRMEEKRSSHTRTNDG